MTLPYSGNALAIDRSGVGIDAAQQPSSSMQKPNLLGEAKHRHTKLSAENVDDIMPSTSIPPLPSKSSEMASKMGKEKGKSSKISENSKIYTKNYRTCNHKYVYPVFRSRKHIMINRMLS